ncbi:hypothetical protein [Streptosporangium vulgare]|uniref:Uncharacterized protein n=1 Tax=Streptosporangium vulgare TaxID=46190 RepID=A0ABV5TEP1_9ACTN
MRHPVLITVVLLAAALGVPRVRRALRAALIRATGTALHTEHGR